MPDDTRTRLERSEDERLAPWALRSARASRRRPVPEEGRAFDYRTEYQRDRDRILYSRAFRRLRQKAQSGSLPRQEDHRRNRLTHTLEVTQVARTIGRALGLNEDLIEALGLGHDLGQPPFGPAGSRALDDLAGGRLDGKGGPALGDLGGFWRAWQGLRVVDLLEKRYESHPGLNLTDDVREGIFKASGGERVPPEVPEGVRAGLAPSLEAQVVALADRIGSATAELDDALLAGHVDPERVERLLAVQELRRKLGPAWQERAGRFARANTIHRGLTHLLVTGSILASEATIRDWAERHGLADAARFAELRDEVVSGREVGLAESGLRLLQDLEGFLESRVRRGHDADRIQSRGRRVLLGLFAAYWADPTLLDDHQLLRYKQAAGLRYLRDVPRDALEREVAEHYRRRPRYARLLVDHLAGMTDAYALGEHARLTEMGAVPIPSAEQLRREDGAAT
jgi:dGTPase